MREKILGTRQVVRNWFRTPNSKISHYIVTFLTLRRASENFNCAPKWARQFVFCPKIVQFFYITFLSLHQRWVSYFNILEAKIEEKVVQNLFDFDQVKHQFVHFWGPKKIETFLNFEFSCWRFF